MMGGKNFLGSAQAALNGTIHVALRRRARVLAGKK
jgi:hypothetical protein